jgi:hypothetical protein
LRQVARHFRNKEGDPVITFQNELIELAERASNDFLCKGKEPEGWLHVNSLCSADYQEHFDRSQAWYQLGSLAYNTFVNGALVHEAMRGWDPREHVS